MIAPRWIRLLLLLATTMVTQAQALDFTTNSSASIDNSYQGTVHAASTVGDSSTGNVNGSSSEYFHAFGTDAPSETLFKTQDGLSAMAPIINLASEALTKPIPTNKWWGNLISTTNTDMNTVRTPAWSNPYAIKLPIEVPYGLQACYSYSYRQKATLTDGAIKYYLHEFHNDMTLSAVEFATTKPDYEIYDWSDFGANLRICAAGGVNCMNSAIVNGMAFVSATYNGLIPNIASDYAISSLEPGDNGKYIIELENKQTWVLYVSGDATASLSIDTTGKAIVGSAAFTGTLRLAVLPEGDSHDAYDAYAGCVVQGGTVSMESRTSYSFNWAVDGSSCETDGLLHFAFAHQIESMAYGTTVNSTGAIILHSTVRGQMVGQVGSVTSGVATWSLTEPELEEPIDFYPPRNPTSDVVEQYNIKSTLEEDIANDWTLNKASYYYAGKAFQKYASLCLMAADNSIVGTDTTLLQTCIDKLEALIEPILTNSLDAPLVYETSYKGIVTSAAFTANDVNQDFGNGVYNDHHYHYGYFITASAILKKLDPTWSRMADLETIVTTMLRDVANPSSDDKYFPKFRHFSWYLGHSYSHGVTPMADGKDQESTSEDINFLYGMMLWGKVSGLSAIEDLGSLMLRIDARAIKTYFLLESSNTIHPPEFVKNHVTGITFDNKVDYATWFSAEKYCIHGIQMIPVSPITEIVRTQTFVQQEWNDILSKEAIVTGNDLTNAWLSLLYVNYATVNPTQALETLQSVALDDGLSRSWALYMAATRPTASTTPSIITEAPTVTPSTTTETPATTTTSPSITPTPSTTTAAPTTTPTPSTTTATPTTTPTPSTTTATPTITTATPAATTAAPTSTPTPAPTNPLSPCTKPTPRPTKMKESLNKSDVAQHTNKERHR